MLKNAPFLEFVFGIVYWTAISVMLAAAANAQHFALMAKTEFPFLFGEFFCLFVFLFLFLTFVLESWRVLVCDF